MSKEKILIVEDDEVTAMHLKMTLKKLEYDVVSIAENTMQARNKIKIYEPDAILLDISTSASRLSKGTDPMSFKYMRTGSSEEASLLLVIASASFASFFLSILT